MRERNQSFIDIAGYFAFYGVGDVKLTGNGEPERLSAVPVSQNFFPLLGVQRRWAANSPPKNANGMVRRRHCLPMGYGSVVSLAILES